MIYRCHGYPALLLLSVLSVYSEAIQKMNQNPGIPPLFRDIFKNAYLPYRDPETLRIFLKEINSFKYDHSERLGDAFEYLLSVLSSQGDAGMFRTPRHIIEFMVDIVDPKKDETILDPACGTAGFLISAYKHILKHNSQNYRTGQAKETLDEKGLPIELLTLDSPLRYKGELLTNDERKRIVANIKGYDISPDMVRLSLVNLYLHGFPKPDIDEYDTLTSDERWNDYADIILANPPFGGKERKEVQQNFPIRTGETAFLFLQHFIKILKAGGRAGVVIKNTFLSNTDNASVSLRKLLLESCILRNEYRCAALIF